MRKPGEVPSYHSCHNARHWELKSTPKIAAQAAVELSPTNRRHTMCLDTLFIRLPSVLYCMISTFASAARKAVLVCLDHAVVFQPLRAVLSWATETACSWQVVLKAISRIVYWPPLLLQTSDSLLWLVSKEKAVTFTSIQLRHRRAQ